MKKYLALLLSLVILLTLTSACSSKSGSGDNTSDTSIENSEDPNKGILVGPEGSGITFEEENENAKIEEVKTPVDKYYGKWAAPSDRAIYLYGNVELQINEDGTWTGTITDEKISGKWKEEGNRIHMTSDVFNFDLVFEKSGKLIMIETLEDGRVMHTVLTKE